MNNTTLTLTRSQRIKNLAPVAWWGAALGLILACLFIPGAGFDWNTYYYPNSLQVPTSGYYNPLWIYLVLKPLAFFPVRVGYVLLCLLTCAGVWVGCRLGQGSRWGALLSLPFAWVIVNGQIDGLIAFGVGLGLWVTLSGEASSPRRLNPWVKNALLGLSVYLLMLKPQTGVLLALLYLLWGRDLRALILPALAGLLSMALWGWDWPLVWLQNLLVQKGNFTTQVTNISLFPWGLAALGALALPLPRPQKAAAVFAATFLASPYAPSYALLALFVLPLPGWAFIPATLPVLFGQEGFRLAALTPLAVLAWDVWLVLRARSARALPPHNPR